MLACRCYVQDRDQRDAPSQCGKVHPASLQAHRVATKGMANKEAIAAVRLQKICMAQWQCRQNSSIQAMTIAALLTIV
jgi:hypothetical protein